MLRGEVLAETERHLSKVYFPHSGVISCVDELAAGGAIETGMIGKDGQFGAGLAALTDSYRARMWLCKSLAMCPSRLLTALLI